MSLRRTVFARAPRRRVILSLSVPYAVVAQASDADLFYRAVAAKRYRDAAVAGRRYLNAHPQEAAFAFDLAYAYFNLGRFDDARRTIQSRDAYLRGHPRSASIWLDLAYKDGDAKRYRQAIAEIDRYLRFRPGDEAAKRQRADDVAALNPAPAASPPAVVPDDGARFYAAVAERHFEDALLYGQRYLKDHPDNDGFAIDLAYAFISAGRVDAAAEIAEQRAAYIRTHGDASALLAALFYAFNQRKSASAAVSYGERYLELRPGDDAFAMDLAYAELGLGNVTRAREIVASRVSYLRAHPDSASIWLAFSYKEADAKRYRAAISDVDTFLQFRPGDRAAKQQRAAYVDDIWSGPRFQSFGYSQYEGRFSDAFFGLDSRYTLAPGVVQPYVASHIVSDIASGAPGTPQIFSDNAVIFDTGVHIRLSPYAAFFGEGGVGIGTRGQGTISDLRYGFLYSQRWGNRAFTEMDASAVVYSRYKGNFISYFTLLHEFGSKKVRPIVGIDGAFDAKSIFGNNFVDGFAGVQLGTDAVALRLLTVNGLYLTRGLPVQRMGYSTFRAMLIFGVAK